MFQVMIRNRLSGEYIFDTPLMESNGNRNKYFVQGTNQHFGKSTVSQHSLLWKTVGIEVHRQVFQRVFLGPENFKVSRTDFWAETTETIPQIILSKNRCFKGMLL